MLEEGEEQEEPDFEDDEVIHAQDMSAVQEAVSEEEQMTDHSAMKVD